MGRVVIAEADSTAVVEFPELAGVTGGGSVRTRAIVAGEDRPILLWMHELAPGAEIRWNRPPVDHLAYVWEGQLEAEGTVLGQASVAIIERGGQAVVRGAAERTRLLHFHRPDDRPDRPAKSGGNVHLIGAQGKFRSPASDGVGWAERAVWADSDCPTCDIWLNEVKKAWPQEIARHFHDTDELLFVLDGGMVLGRRTLSPGTALAIDARTIYTFKSAPNGLTFLNFRTSDSEYVEVDAKNQPIRTLRVRDELRRKAVSQPQT